MKNYNSIYKRITKEAFKWQLKKVYTGENDSASNWHEIAVEKATALQNNNYQEVM